MDELLEEVTGYLKRGFTMVKMKVGRTDIRQDAERVRAVRNVMGDKVRLMVDANQAWTPQQAITFARLVEGQDIYWFEEPVAKDDLDGYCQVATKSSIPIATGEREYSLDCAVEVGHVASKLQKLGALLGMACVQVC